MPEVDVIQNPAGRKACDSCRSGEGPVTAYPDPTLTTSLRPRGCSWPPSRSVQGDAPKPFVTKIDQIISGTLVKDVKDCWGEAIPVYDDINWYDKKVRQTDAK